MRTSEGAMQMWDSRMSRSYLCSLDWSDTSVKASPQSRAMLELIFLSHDREGHRVSEVPLWGGGVHALQVALRLSYFFKKYKYRKIPPLLSVKLSQHLLEMLPSTPTFGQHSWQLRCSSAWCVDVSAGGVMHWSWCNPSWSCLAAGCADGICLSNDCAGSIDVDWFFFFLFFLPSNGLS